ncbi:MAG: hypothetical protein GC190_05250 [Alphaproteobacteria bacterium]|nr:hypothetical protein [Alphaproteobacteria bacterium]
MFSTLWNLFLVTAAICVAAAFQVGALAPGDAFFAAIAIVLVFTGQQIMVREHMGLYGAARSLLTRPDSYRSRVGYLSYFACLAVGVLVTLQVAALAVA